MVARRIPFLHAPVRGRTSECERCCLVADLRSSPITHSALWTALHSRPIEGNTRRSREQRRFRLAKRRVGLPRPIRAPDAAGIPDDRRETARHPWQTNDHEIEQVFLSANGVRINPSSAQRICAIDPDGTHLRGTHISTTWMQCQRSRGAHNHSGQTIVPPCRSCDLVRRRACGSRRSHR